MNKFPTWRYFVIIVGLHAHFYALPNLYPAQPDQVAYTDSSKSADQSC